MTNEGTVQIDQERKENHDTPKTHSNNNEHAIDLDKESLQLLLEKEREKNKQLQDLISISGKKQKKAKNNSEILSLNTPTKTLTKSPSAKSTKKTETLMTSFIVKKKPSISANITEKYFTQYHPRENELHDPNPYKKINHSFDWNKNFPEKSSFVEEIKNSQNKIKPYPLANSFPLY
ncbi:MAG: hypothetical protein MHPSP_000100 [Paramarteilia canceri]